jgi:hypothetical protein
MRYYLTPRLLCVVAAVANSFKRLTRDANPGGWGRHCLAPRHAYQNPAQQHREHG